jgi:hypothetical protein
MKQYEVKDTKSGIVSDVDTTGRRVKVVINEMGSKDLDGDVMDKGAYKRSIDTRGPKGANLIWHLTDHAATLKNAIGKPSEINTNSTQLVYVTDIPKTSWGNDMLEFYKSGTINQHSIGFKTIKAEMINKGKEDEYRLIKEVMLYEGSAVLWGANQNTPTLSVGKSITKEEAENIFTQTLKEIGSFTKLLKDANFTDETFELIEIQLIQKTDKLQSLFQSTTQPAVSALDPGKDVGLLDVFKTFNNSLILQNGSQRFASTA